METRALIGNGNTVHDVTGADKVACGRKVSWLSETSERTTCKGCLKVAARQYPAPGEVPFEQTPVGDLYYRALSIGYTQGDAAQFADSAFYATGVGYGDECLIHVGLRKWDGGDGCDGCRVVAKSTHEGYTYAGWLATVAEREAEAARIMAEEAAAIPAETLPVPAVSDMTVRAGGFVLVAGTTQVQAAADAARILIWQRHAESMVKFSMALTRGLTVRLFNETYGAQGAKCRNWGEVAAMAAVIRAEMLAAHVKAGLRRP